MLCLTRTSWLFQVSTGALGIFKKEHNRATFTFEIRHKPLCHDLNSLSWDLEKKNIIIFITTTSIYRNFAITSIRSRSNGLGITNTIYSWIVRPAKAPQCTVRPAKAPQCTVRPAKSTQCIVAGHIYNALCYTQLFRAWTWPTTSNPTRPDSYNSYASGPIKTMTELLP